MAQEFTFNLNMEPVEDERRVIRRRLNTSTEEEQAVTSETDVPFYSAEVIVSIPSLRELMFDICFSTEQTKQYLSSHGVFYNQESYIYCSGGSRMYFVEATERRKAGWRCNGIINPDNNQRCCRGSKRTVRLDSFFFNRNLTEDSVMLILYFWLKKSSNAEIMSGVKCSAKDVGKVIRGIHSMIQQDLSEEDDCRVGGLDADGNPIIVEIDESKFGKRKHNRGHHVNGVWVVGGVEKTSQRKIFLTTVEKRNKPVLERVISRFVKPGSIVRTDCCEIYNGLRLLPINIRHETVNHSEGFSINGIHTNAIEGSWNGIKQNIPARLRTKKAMPWNLVEFIWRRKHCGDLWGGLINCLKIFSLRTLSDTPDLTEDLLQEGDVNYPEVSEGEEQDPDEFEG